MISKWTKSAVIIAGVILLVTLLFYFGYGYSIRWGGELDSAATSSFAALLSAMFTGLVFLITSLEFLSQRKDVDMRSMERILTIWSNTVNGLYYKNKEGSVFRGKEVFEYLYEDWVSSKKSIEYYDLQEYFCSDIKMSYILKCYIENLLSILKSIEMCDKNNQDFFLSYIRFSMSLYERKVLQEYIKEDRYIELKNFVEKFDLLPKNDA